MNENPNTWTEADSATYQQLAVVAVPDRADQVATVVSLLPFDRDAAFQAVELGSGQGFLLEVLLECFPNATMLALDGSAEMRADATRRLERLGSRFSVQPFDINATDWLARLQGMDCVVSSLCVHHLDGTGKQRLFKGVFEKLSANGVLIIADLIEPERVEARQLFATTWDRETRTRSREKLEGDSGYELFLAEKWNIYRYPDPMDQPSPLFQQLLWLQDAGFDPVDCFWMKAGHAIYGGYKPGAKEPIELVDGERVFDVALAVMQESR